MLVRRRRLRVLRVSRRATYRLRRRHGSRTGIKLKGTGGNWRRGSISLDRGSSLSGKVQLPDLRCIITLLFLSAYRCPFSPPANNKDPILAAWPKQNVCTGEEMYYHSAQLTSFDLVRLMLMKGYK